MQYPWGYAYESYIISTRESYHQYPWVISSVPVSHILSTREDMQYPWVISSVPVRICSTCEDMHTRESYPQYPWYAVPVRICSTREGSFIHSGTAYPHGYWGYDSRVLMIWLTGTDDMTHGYCISSPVLRIWLTGTEDMTKVLMIWLTGTAYPHRYWGYDSRVLMIWLTGTAYPHRYWGFDSRIWLTGTDDMTHG